MDNTFNFEKLIVYQKAEMFCICTNKLLQNTHCDLHLKDQLKRATISITLNIAEGAGRYSKPDKKIFYIMARGSIFECTAILRILKKMLLINNIQYENLYKQLNTLSRLLSALINKMATN